LPLLSGCSPEIIAALQNSNNLPKPGASTAPTKPDGAPSQPEISKDTAVPLVELKPGEALILKDAAGNPIGKQGKAIPPLSPNDVLVIDPAELLAPPVTGKDAPEPAGKKVPHFAPALLPEEIPLLPDVLVDKDSLPTVQTILLTPLVQDIDKILKGTVDSKPIPPSADRTRGGAGTEVTISGSGFGKGGAAVMDGLLGSVPAEILSWSVAAVRVRVPEGARPGANRLSLRYGDGITYDSPFEVTSVSVPLSLIRSVVNAQLRTLSLQVHNHSSTRGSRRPYYEQSGRSFMSFRGQVQPLTIPPVVRDLGFGGTLEGYINGLASSSATAELNGTRFRLTLAFADRGVEIINYNTGGAIPRWFEDDAMPNVDLRNTSVTVDLRLALSGGRIGYGVENVVFQSEMTTAGVLPDSLIRALYDYRAEIKRQVESTLRANLEQGVTREQIVSALNEELRRTLGLPAGVALTGLQTSDSAALLTWN
jgi:hypothetical protein